MRGDDRRPDAMFSYVSPEERIPQDHPLRAIRGMVDAVLRELSPRFSKIYSDVGRPSIAPEKLLRALLLQVLYTIRSEGLPMDERVWNPTVFTKNRERLLSGDIDRLFFEQVLAQARGRGLLSDEHFT